MSAAPELIPKPVQQPDPPALSGPPGFWRRFLRHRLAALGLVIICLVTASAALAPFITPYGVNTFDFASISQPPSSIHWLGTDELGRDILTRIFFGGRVSLAVGFSAVAISATIGIILGAVAGFFGGVVDQNIMRLTDVMLAFPVLLLLIAVTPILGASMRNVILALGLFGWPGICRIARGQFLAVRNELYVEAASAGGAPAGRIIFRHVLPNASAPLIVAATLGVAGAILTEAGLSFLGLGIQPPTPTWGNMLHAAQSLTVLTQRPWQWLGPGTAIALSVLSINFIGDGLRDALDPRWVSGKKES